jgi:hypothetical protein
VSNLRRLILIVLLLAGACGSSIAPIRNSLREGSGNKDYPLWYTVGQAVRMDVDLYPTDPNIPFPFLYPPPAAIILALLSYLGKTGMVVAICIVNSLAWAVAVYLSATLLNASNVWHWLLPTILWWPLFNDNMLLGQPNILLLTLCLGSLMLIRDGWRWVGGLLLGLAIAIKAFPVLILCYLVYRRYWIGLLSAILTTLALLVLTGFVRGHEKNLAEVQAWTKGMLFSSGSEGFAQRGTRNMGWKNFSLWSVGQRLLRPVNAELESPEVDPIYMNIFSLSYQHALYVLVGIAAVIGLAFIVVLPRSEQRTAASDAAEISLLLCLVTIASPVCHTYYFIWLLPAVTLFLNVAIRSQSKSVRSVSWAILGATGLLVLLSVEFLTDSHVPQSYGSGFWAVMLLCVGLAWQIRVSTSQPREPQLS